MKIRIYYIEFFLLLAVFSSVVQFGIYESSALFPATLIVVSALLFLKVNYFNLEKHVLNMLGFVALAFVYSLLASLLQQSFEAVVTFGFFTLAAALFTLVGYNAQFNLRVYYKYFLYICLIVCLMSFLSGFSVYQFKGVYSNENQMGLFASVLFGIYLIILIADSNKESLGYKALLLGSCFVFFIFMLASNSRTSLISALVPLGLLGLFSALQLVKFKYYSFWMSKSAAAKFALLALFLCGFYILFNNLGYVEPIITKFEATAANGDITSDRAYRWLIALQYISPIASGQQLYMGAGVGGVHNNYLHLSLVFGWIGALLFYTPFIYMLYRSVLEIFKGKNLAAQLCFFSSLYFIIFSIAEVGSAVFLIWLCFISFGYLLSGRK